MDPSYKHLVSDMKIARIQKLRTRPSSSNYQGNARDPKWMRLFHPKAEKILSLKISKLQRYSADPPKKKIEVRPKLEISTFGLTRALSYNTIEKDEKKIEMALETIPEFSVLDGINLSRIGTDSWKQGITTRPSTARPVTARISRPSTARVVGSKSEQDFSLEKRFRDSKPEQEYSLEKRGPEFVAEVLKMWENIEAKKTENLPLIHEQGPAQLRSQSKLQISQSQSSLKNSVPESFGMKVQPKVLTFRDTYKPKYSTLTLSNSSKFL